MYREKSYNTTTSRETLLPITYIESYKDPAFKKFIHTYKFTKNFNKEYTNAKHTLSRYVDDICFNTANRFQTLFYTCPPSTMYAKKEKREDSMRELFISTVYTHTRIFTIQTKYLTHTKAQHLFGSRKHRTSDLHSRYTISKIFRFKLWCLYTFLNKKRFSFCIIDDISSTGGTLQACRDTLDTCMQHIQRKYPDIFWDIQVFSIGH